MAGILKIIVMALLCGTAVLCRAEPFFDPTRPPPAFLPAEMRAAEHVEKETPLELQSILLAPQRKIAVISGLRLKPGQSIRGYQLLSLGSSEARLLGPNGVITLKLLSARSREAELASAADSGKNSLGEPK